MCTTQLNINFDICDRLMAEFNIQSEKFESNLLFQSVRNEYFFNEKKITLHFSGLLYFDTST